MDFIRQASKDPDVLAIKQTQSAEFSHHQVVCGKPQAGRRFWFELKARFDEEHNIVWAKKLETADCHVIYGLVGPVHFASRWLFSPQKL